MTTLADAPELIGFFSYSRDDDEDSENALSKLRLRIQSELRAQLGRSRQTLRLWQDAEAIAPGTLWEAQIDAAVTQSSFFIPIITPRVIASHYCGLELQKFIDRENALGRSDLVFPILYIGVAELTDERFWRDHAVQRVVGERQYVDWREFRYEPDSVAARRAIAGFCSNIAATLKQTSVATNKVRNAIVYESGNRTSEPASVSSRVDERSPVNSGDTEEQASKAKVSTPDSFLGHRVKTWVTRSLNPNSQIDLWVIIGFCAVVNLLYVTSIRWLNRSIPYFDSVSSHIPGVSFGFVLIYISNPMISRRFAWAFAMVSTIIGWYLASNATVAFLGNIVKIVPEDYLRSALGGAIGGAVGISCCLVGLCIGNRRLANLESVSIAMLTAVIVGSVLFPLFLRTGSGDLQAWSDWAFWLLLVGWQSSVAIALRNQTRSLIRIAGD